MYYQYFGLTEAPFSIAVNPRYLFMSDRHRDALAHLLYGVGAGGGFILLTGEVGTGKTTINRCLLEQLPQDTDIAIILNPALNAIELLASVCDELGIVYDQKDHTLKSLTDSLHSFLLENHNRSRKTVLLIDEAQHLDFTVLEQIRLLTNLETNSEKLLQIILIGQPELSQMLARPELRQLNQRITARYNLEPLNLEETGAYIHHRLMVAGMSPERVIFPRAIVRSIHGITRGIPRVINVLCDRILLGAYGRNKTQADRSMLTLAKKEVLGDQARGGSSRRWILALVPLLLLVAVIGWLAYEYKQTPAAPAPAHESSKAEGAVLPSAVESHSGSVTALSERPSPESASPRASVTLDVPREPEQIQLSIDTPAATPAMSAFLASGEAMGILWAMHDQSLPGTSACPREPSRGVACIAGEVATWNDLGAYDRPLVLSVVTPERFAAEVLLLGMVDGSAWVLVGDNVERVKLADLAGAWSGGYRFLWHPPRGFEQPVALGEQSPVVAEIASLFARLDGQPEPLARDRFNTQLQSRVRLFQRAQGLSDDGVVGLQTLLKLNEQLGIDTTAVMARERLATQPGESAP